MISIVMLTYNNHDTFLRCITSMFPFFYDERIEEILILDNGSKDVGLIEKLKQLHKNIDKIKVIFSGFNLGIAKGRKLLFDISKGDYICSIDSDVVVINHDLFLTIFMDALKIEELWLVGGGGGNHPFFPSFFMEDINNLPSAENPRQMTIVDEVAGWFQGFRKNRLKTFGGPIYMDEQFTPFWGEDSDFCAQIKVLGGKCAIMGKGVIAHTWSSCDKSDTRTTLHCMWKKFRTKWDNHFGEIYNVLKFSEDFYKENYDIEHPDLRTHYLRDGITRGYLPCKELILNIYPDVNFKDNKKLTYNQKEYNTREFIDDYMNIQKIKETCFKIENDNIKDGGVVIFLTSSDDQRTLEDLKQINENSLNFSIALCYFENPHPKSIEFLKTNFNNYFISSFYDYGNHVIPFLILLEHFKNHKFTNIIKTNNASLKTFTNRDICNFNFPHDKKILYNTDTIKKLDKFNMDIIKDSITIKENYLFSDNFVMEFEFASKLIDSYPVKNMLQLALRVPIKYNNFLTPKHSPVHGLERLICYQSDFCHEKYPLVIIICDLENDLQIVSHNCEKLKETGKIDIAIFDKGSYSGKISDLDIDFFQKANGDKNDELTKGLLKNIKNLNIYSNFIFINNKLKLLDPIYSFFERSYYKNISLLPIDNPCKLYSITKFDIEKYIRMVVDIGDSKDEKMDINKTISFNTKNNFNMSNIWEIKVTETEGEKIIEYYQKNDPYTPIDDFPAETLDD